MINFYHTGKRIIPWENCLHFYLLNDYIYIKIISFCTTKKDDLEQRLEKKLNDNNSFNNSINNIKDMINFFKDKVINQKRNTETTKL